MLSSPKFFIVPSPVHPGIMFAFTFPRWFMSRVAIVMLYLSINPPCAFFPGSWHIRCTSHSIGWIHHGQVETLIRHGPHSLQTVHVKSPVFHWSAPPFLPPVPQWWPPRSPVPGPAGHGRNGPAGAWPPGGRSAACCRYGFRLSVLTGPDPVWISPSHHVGLFRSLPYVGRRRSSPPRTCRKTPGERRRPMDPPGREGTPGTPPGWQGRP